MLRISKYHLCYLYFLNASVANGRILFGFFVLKSIKMVKARIQTHIPLYLCYGWANVRLSDDHLGNMFDNLENIIGRMFQFQDTVTKIRNYCGTSKMPLRNGQNLIIIGFANDTKVLFFSCVCAQFEISKCLDFKLPVLDISDVSLKPLLLANTELFLCMICTIYLF